MLIQVINHYGKYLYGEARQKVLDAFNNDISLLSIDNHKVEILEHEVEEIEGKDVMIIRIFYANS